ncbi:MAG: type II toxin-antitoxin system VapC family toxin [Gemmatimonadales bacterium]
MIVADANLIADLLLGGREAKVAETVLELDAIWTAPVLWRSEFRSILAAYMRQRDLSISDAWRAHELAERLFVGREFSIGGEVVLRLVADSRCSAYDCEYVALAQDLAAPLVTRDRQVLREFPAVAVTPKRFIADNA